MAVGKRQVSTRIVVVNTGETSVKLASFAVVDDGIVEIERMQRAIGPGQDVGNELRQSLDALDAAPDVIGHRFVSAGPNFRDPVLLTTAVEQALKAAIPLAPVHNGAALRAIRTATARFPTAAHVIAFDTAFHASRPAVSMEYALPRILVESFQFRRYGFHGFAHESLTNSLAETTQTARSDISAVTLQLGGGCSACAVQRGRSIETSMGYSPLEGLVMMNRSGSVDPAVVLRLVHEGLDVADIERDLNRRSGLHGMTGLGDMCKILEAADRGDARAASAIEVFCHRIVLTRDTSRHLLLRRREPWHRMDLHRSNAR